MSNRFILPHIVQTALDAANAGSTEAFLDCFAPGGAVNDWGRVFRGRDAIRGWSDAEFIGAQVELAPTRAQTDGATVTSAPTSAATASTAPRTSRSPPGTA